MNKTFLKVTAFEDVQMTYMVYISYLWDKKSCGTCRVSSGSSWLQVPIIRMNEHQLKDAHQQQIGSATNTNLTYNELNLKLPKHQIESKIFSHFTDVAPDELTNRTWKPLWQASDQSLGPTTRTVLSPSKRSISAAKNPALYTNFRISQESPWISI